MSVGQTIGIVGLCCALSCGCAAPKSQPRGTDAARSSGDAARSGSGAARPGTARAGTDDNRAVTNAARPGSGVARGTAQGATVTRRDTYTVRPKDTLYSIAWRHHLDYRELAKWNHLSADFHIAVGQVLILQPGGAPAPALRPSSASTLPTPPGSAAPSGTAPASSATLVPPALTGAVAANTPMKWVWPTDRTTPPRSVPGGGILLLGRLGQEIRAANAGRVVYTGSGLRGYGNLIILKHGESWLSAYAHNRELLVREGQEVLAGQGIARMGQGPHQIAALYFEIRLNGKPVDPLRYLANLP